MPGSRGVSKEAVGPPVQNVSCRGRKKVIADRVVDVQGGGHKQRVSHRDSGDARRLYLDSHPRHKREQSYRKKDISAQRLGRTLLLGG